MTRRCPFLRRFLLIIGPFGHLLLFGPAQVYTISEYLTHIWHWHATAAWPIALVAGYVPIVGSILATSVVHLAPQLVPVSPWYATALFAGMPLLFGLLARFSKCRNEVLVEPRIQSGITIADW